MSRNNKALLIIDMQQVSFTPQTPRFDAENVIERINRLSELFRNKNWPVIFIQHDGSSQGFCQPGTDEWKILPSLTHEPNDIVISKTANDSFYRTSLHAFLQENNIADLVITGCATDYCVDATVKSALAHDYEVTVVADAHTAADRPFLKAEVVVEYFNYLWADFIPTQGQIRVVPAHSFVSGLTR